MAERKVVILRCADGTDLEVEEEVAMMSMTIRRKIEAGCNSFVELTGINSATLCKVIEYCNKHAATASSASAPSATALSALKDWDIEFISTMDETTLSHIISASDHLDIKGLLQLSVGKKLVTLRCGVDHDNFIVEGHIAMKLRLLRPILLGDPKCANSPIHLPNLTSAALAPVLEFYRRHAWAKAVSLSKTKINEMNRQYVKLYTPRCFDLIRAASFLQASYLLEVLVKRVKAIPRLAELSQEEIVDQVAKRHYTEEEENAMVVQLAKK